MADLKTKPTSVDVTEFLSAIPDPVKRDDSRAICEIMRKITREQPVMWGSAIVGFGSYHYKYASGREGDWPITGFSPRKQAISIYLCYGFERHQDLLSKLGKYSTGVACLYIKRLEDVDVEVLKQLIKVAIATMKEKLGPQNGVAQVL